MRTILIVALFFPFLFLAQAQEHEQDKNPVFHLATITSDAIPDINKLYLETDDNNVAQKVLITTEQTQDTSTFPVGQLFQGIVLMRTSGVDVAILKSKNFNQEQGGQLTLDYVFNGVLRQRRQLQLEAEFNGEWQLFYQGKRFNRIQVIANRTLGQVVGIRQILFLFQANEQLNESELFSVEQY